MALTCTPARSKADAGLTTDYVLFTGGMTIGNEPLLDSATTPTLIAPIRGIERDIEIDRRFLN
ncbi:MAG: hypothetical protein IPG34_07820 [Rhodocyclaceae bacterium]|nr:hypothetical protein [Rhodocyclaceae bacterium]